MAYSKLNHLIEMLTGLATKMRATPVKAKANGDEMAALVGPGFADQVRRSSRAYWYELSHPDHVRELESIIATFRPKKRRSNVRR